MNYENPIAADRKQWFHARPIFFLAFAALLAVIAFPDVVRGSYILKRVFLLLLKRVFLLLATLALLSGWFFLLRDASQIALGELWLH